MPWTSTLHLSIISVHSASHTPSLLWIFPSLSCIISLSSATLHIIQKMAQLKEFPYCPAHYIFISQLYALVCCFLLSCFPNPFFLSQTRIQVQVFLKLYLSASLICECVGSVCPGVCPPGAAPLRMRASAFRHAALWAMINLWELSRCLSSSSAELWARGSWGTAGLPVAGSSTLSLLRGLDSTGLLSGPLTWNIFRPTVQHCS